MSSDILVLVQLNDRIQKFLPTICTVNIAGPKQYSFTITELIEAEQRMETGTPEMTVVCLSLLLAMNRALRTVHVQNDSLMQCFAHRFLNPLTIDIGQVSEILLLSQYLSFKTSHRVGAGSLLAFVLLSGYGSHDGINGLLVGVIYIFITRKSAVYRLTQESGHIMLDITTCAFIDKNR